MSSCPGTCLEDFLAWQWDLIVNNDPSANWSLMAVEKMGIPTRRIQVTNTQFAAILALYEPYRETVEQRLDDFDEDNQSWRGYAGYAFDFIPDNVTDAAEKLREEYRLGIQPVV